MIKADVLILSSSFGGGHRSVSEALKEEMEETYGLKVFIVDPYEYLNKRLNRLNAELYIKLMRNAPALYGLFYNITYDLEMGNVVNRIGSYIGRGSLLKLIDLYKPKVVVSTYPTYTGMLSHLKKRGMTQSYSATVITDFAAHSQWIHEYADVYFVASHEVALTLIKKGIPNGRIHVSGIPIKKSFSEEYDVVHLKEKYGLQSDTPLILVMNVSFGNPNVLKEICKTLSSLSVPFQSLVLCGMDERLFKIASSFDRKILPLRGSFNIAELMSISKILITKSGGVTTSEGLAKEVPMVFYKPVQGQEWHNADYVSRHGAGVVVKRENELKNIINALLMDKGLQDAIRERAKRIAHPYASKYVARYINDVIQKL